MEVIYLSLDDDFVMSQAIAACIGYFDGLHLGHQALINATNEYKHQHNIKSAMISFEPDPWIVTKKLKEVKHINDFESKKSLLEHFKVDYLLILRFTEQMAALKSEEFINMLSNKLNLKALIVGFDFKYGQFGSGNIDVIDSQVHQRFDVIKVDAVCDDVGKISSSRIDNTLMNGSIESASQMLGYDYFIIGEVIHGRKQGTEIGYPTANIKYDENILLPKNGVYIGVVDIDGVRYKSMINIGNNPTFNYKQQLSLEVHLIDFNKMIYGERIKVTFKSRIRDEIKFASKHELISQLEADNRMAAKQSL